MKKFIKWCRRYFSILGFAVLAFAIYTFFIKDPLLPTYLDNIRIADSLRAEIKNAEDSIALYERMNKRLISDPEMMERVVREQYNMVREGEDVYVYK